MEEVVVYVTEGAPDDKNAQESVGVAASVHSAHHFALFRNAECHIGGAAVTGVGAGERLFVAAKDKALISAYAWGREGVDQKFPVPEQMAALAVAHHPLSPAPWLLAGGLKLGKIYVWELASGALLCVRDAHYQAVSVLKFSKCGTFLVSGGADARVAAWLVAELILPSHANPKPVAAFASHSLGVTDVALVEGRYAADLRLFSASKDATVRLYTVVPANPLATFVFTHPVHCLAADHACRAIYAGLEDGTVRSVPLYRINHNHVLEAVLGTNKVVSVDENSGVFAQHQAEDCVPTRLLVTADGTALVSGDTHGRVFVTDVATRQVLKTYTPVKSPIAHVELFLCSVEKVKEARLSKQHRLLEPLKRTLVLENLATHTVGVQLPPRYEEEETKEEWLERKKQELRAFGAAVLSDREAELEEKLKKLSEAYTQLRGMYEDLQA